MTIARRPSSDTIFQIMAICMSWEEIAIDPSSRGRTKRIKGDRQGTRRLNSRAGSLIRSGMTALAMAEKPLMSWAGRRAHPGKPAPFLPMSRAEMTALGWDACDIVLVTGDAYVDHPSFGMAIIGRLLEAQGFRVGIIAQPDWHSAEPFKALGKPRVFFGVTGGNMDSMVNRYTADRRLRSDDAYTPEIGRA